LGVTKTTSKRALRGRSFTSLGSTNGGAVAGHFAFDPRVSAACSDGLGGDNGALLYRPRAASSMITRGIWDDLRDHIAPTSAIPGIALKGRKNRRK
jgi:hypothetical protein